jgi:hypothetical protein
MYLSAERMAVANQAIQETFEQSSIAWQAIPHWDTGDPGQTRVRYDVTYVAPEDQGPLGGEPLEPIPISVPFKVTLAQADAPTPDALLAAVIPRTVTLAKAVDTDVVGKLRDGARPFTGEFNKPATIQKILNALIDARVDVEEAGYRAPSCLLVSKAALKALSYLVGGVPVTESLLDVANINSLHRVAQLDETDIEITRSEHDEQESEENKPTEQEAAAQKTPTKKAAQAAAAGRYRVMLMLGRRQRIAHGCAATASPGEEPVDLAVSVPPSLEVVGETADGNIDLAVRIRYATRIKDAYGVRTVVYDNS